MTQTQAVEAIRTADTVEAIAVVLQGCAKIKDMSAVFEAVVGERYYGKTVAIKKDELAWNMAYQLMRRRENEAFKALSVSDKLRKLCAMDAYDTSRYVHQCEMDELREIASELGVKVEESEDEFILKVQLDYQDAIVKELIARADDKADDTETSQPEALYEDDTYSDFSGDNSAHEQDIPECHEPENVTAEKILLAENISKNEVEITAMLNKYAENRATRRAILDGVRFFQREIKKRTEKGLSSEKLPEAILSVKEEYRRLRLEGFQLRRKLLRVICAEEISQACAKYVARCREIQRRHTGK